MISRAWRVELGKSYPCTLHVLDSEGWMTAPLWLLATLLESIPKLPGPANLCKFYALSDKEPKKKSCLDMRTRGRSREWVSWRSESISANPSAPFQREAVFWILVVFSSQALVIHLCHICGGTRWNLLTVLTVHSNRSHYVCLLQPNFLYKFADLLFEKTYLSDSGQDHHCGLHCERWRSSVADPSSLFLRTLLRLIVKCFVENEGI